MIRRFCTAVLLFCLPVFSFSQIVTYSEPLKGDSRDLDFEIMGKVNGNLLVFKNTRSDYAITAYDNQMKIKETVALGFLPDKTFNVNFITYPDFIYLIYQYQKKKIVYCAAIKIDADAKVLTQPVTIDSTDIGNRDNKIYTAINSEDKQKIMIVKMQKESSKLNLATVLLDNTLQPIKRSFQDFTYNDNKNVFDNFLVDNDGDLVFTISSKLSNREYFNQLALVTKSALADTFSTKNIDLKEKYTDDIIAKIDNVNKHYILTTFFYTEKRGNAQGIYAATYNKQNDSTISSSISFGDSVRLAVKKGGNKKEAFNDFAIKNMIIKKDGGYILMTEDYYVQQSNGNGYNHLNRWDYFYNSLSMSPFGYNPYYYNPYNPYGFNNMQTTSYYYKNIFVVSIDKFGNPEWNNVLYKDQEDDISDNALSYATFTTGGEIHLLFNELIKRKQVIIDNSLTANGEININANLNGLNKDYEFLPRFGKQVGAKQFIIPCTYRNSICFAKIDY